MTDRWTRRKAHSRRLKSGRVTFVRESWVFHELTTEAKSGSYSHPCQMCGARILSVHMPNGGWSHFEAAKGLRRVKHPCMHLGLGLPDGRDELTLDLFEKREA